MFIKESHPQNSELQIHLALNMQYKIYQPNAALSALVDYYYHTKGSFNKEERTILPDGRVDLVFVLSAGVRTKEMGTTESVMPGGLLQARKKEIFSVVYDGQLELVGIRFSPKGTVALLGLPMAELPEYPIPLTDIFKKEAQELEESLFEKQDLISKIKLIEHWLACRLKRVDLKHQWEWDWLDKLMSTSGTVSLQDLLQRSDSNYKRIQRFFRDQLGIPPKYFARILRLEAIHQDLRMNGNASIDWMSVVVKYGFYDQSHLVREFRQMTGHSPEQFIADLPQFI